MSAYIFDSETTGAKEPEIVEAAWLHIDSVVSLNVVNEFLGRFKPSKAIELKALAIHHILDEELTGCCPSASFQLPADAKYLIGHNIDYDWEAAGNPEVKRICTLGISKRLWPTADSHNQSALLYLLERQRAGELLRQAHSAGADVRNNLILLNHIVDQTAVCTWDELWDLSESCRVPELMPFGKHKGARISDIPADYKRWLLNQPDIDPYLIRALQ